MDVKKHLRFAADSVHLGRSVIYLIEIGQRFYVGSAKCLRRRIQEHLRDLTAGSHVNKIIQRSFNKYKEFWVSVVECLPKNANTNDRLRIEQHYIDLLYGDEMCMNIMPKATITGEANCRKVVIDGVTHRSVDEAAKAIGAKPSAMSNWLSGYTSLPKRFQFTELRYDGEPNRFRRDARLRPVVIDGRVFPSSKEASLFLGVNKAMIAVWVKGEQPVPSRIKLAELRYADQPSSSIRRQSSRKRVIVNGQTFESVVDASRHLGVAANAIAAWVSGRSSMPAKHGIEDLRYEDESKPKPNLRKSKVVRYLLIDGVKMSRQEFMETYKVTTGDVYTWMTGNAPIPKRVGVSSICAFGCIDKSRVTDKRKSVRVNGQEFPSTAEVARHFQTSKSQVSSWLRGVRPVPKKYNIFELRYA